jgi:C-terminal processing protease CtpA/Prc
LNPGDEFVILNGIPLARLDTEQLVQLLSQSRNQPVQLMIRRPGNSRLIPLVLTPETVDAPSVERAFHVRPALDIFVSEPLTYPRARLYETRLSSSAARNCRADS